PLPLLALSHGMSLAIADVRHSPTFHALRLARSATRRHRRFARFGEWRRSGIRSNEADAAMVWLGFELGLQVGGAESVEQACEQVEVHAADQAGVVLGQALEWAVRQRDAGVVGAWLKAMRRENPRH